MSAGASSNAGKFRAKFAALANAFDLTLPGASGSAFGKDLLANTAVDIRDQVVGDGVSPDGTPLAENRGKYAERKEARGLPVGIGLRSSRSGDAGRMLSHQELMGEQSIGPDEATMRFGTNDRTRKVGEWFTGGSEGAHGCEPSGAAGQPPRRFYGMTQETQERRREECRDQLRRAIKQAGG
jgi:hypothetical protein